MYFQIFALIFLIFSTEAEAKVECDKNQVYYELDDKCVDKTCYDKYFQKIMPTFDNNKFATMKTKFTPSTHWVTETQDAILILKFNDTKDEGVFLKDNLDSCVNTTLAFFKKRDYIEGPQYVRFSQIISKYEDKESKRAYNYTILKADL